MSSLNEVSLIGNLGSDPELKTTGTGTPLCTFSLATSERWTNKNSGQPEEETTWHRVVAWRKLAELCAQYLAKGKKAYVKGKIKHRSYEDETGQTRYITEIVAKDVIFLSPKDGGGGGYGNNGGGSYYGTPGPRYGSAAPSTPAVPAPPEDDDMPF